MSETTKEVATLTIRGTEYPVSLRVYTHAAKPSSTFVLEGLKQIRRGSAQEITADTLEALYDLGMAASKSKNTKIAMPVMQINWASARHATSREWQHGKIVGRHAGTGNLLIQWDGKKVEQDTSSRYGDDAYFRPMQESEQTRYADLLVQQDKIRDEIKAFVARHGISRNELDRLVAEEIERVASETEDR